MAHSMNACMNGADLAAAFVRTFGGSPEGIIFDCDGVMVESRAANTHYYNLLRRGVGLPPMTPEQERYVHMSTTQEAINRIIPPHLLPAVGEVARNISYVDEIQPLLRPMPGLPALLEACLKQGLRLAVDTNRGDSMEPLLKQFAMESMFHPVVTSLSVPEPKPAPDGALLILGAWDLPPEKALFVGDSSTDRMAAAGAGIPFLAFGDQEPSDMGCCSSFEEFLTAMRIVWDYKEK